MDLEQFVCEVLWVSMSQARVDVLKATEFYRDLCDLRDRVYVEPTPLEDFIF